MVQNAKTKKVHITYTVNWLKTPENRKIDVFGVGVKYGDVDDNSIGGYYAYTKYVGNKSIKRYTKKLKNTVESLQGVAMKVNLVDNNLKVAPSILYKNHVLSMHCTATPNSNGKKNKKVICVADYYHQESTIQFSPSVGVGSAGVSAGRSTKMHHITPNIKHTLKIK